MDNFSQSFNMRQRAWIAGLVALLAFMGVAALLLTTANSAQAAGTITVEILAAPNLVVDSNASSPSTYAPSVATVAGKICNASTSATVSQVTASIGTYSSGGSGTAGTYPGRDSATFVTTDPLYNTGTYRLVHLGGSQGTADASRYIGDLAPGQCVVQYWHFVYPQCSNTSPTWTFNPPPCEGSSIPVWGSSVKPEDDLWLTFDVWAKDAGGTNWNYDTHKVTMRNEISAMANKIQPNPDGRWFNTDNDTVLPGDIVTTNGILYELGVINQGFDNDGDFVPDFNAWMQPIGNAGYDPSCFRLIRTSGTVTVTRSGGNPDVVMNFVDQLYFSNLPSDNTGVRGKVYYSFLALTGPCSSTLSPYQEVASGYDNEKFNGDYGTGIPGVRSPEPNFTIDKTGSPGQQSPGGAITYSILFQNTGTAGLGMLMLNGTPVNQPLAIFDSVPAGTTYTNDTASLSCSVSGTILYSNDNRLSWSTAPSGTVTDLQWRLSAPLPAGVSCTAGFSVTVNNPTGLPVPIIDNEACGALGGGTPLACDSTTTLVSGTGSIGDRVWLDQNGDSLQTTGEVGISGITVWLYWDTNSNGFLDDSDVLLLTTETSGTGASNYDFTNLPAGNYIVKVDVTDIDLAGNTTPTTADFFAVALPAGYDYNLADFGFAPALRLDKYLVSYDPAVIGETITFKIDLRNTLPGDGTSYGNCVYYIWPSVAATDSVAGKQFTNPGNAMGAPNFTYATAAFNSGANQWMSGSTFSSGGHTSNITSVEAVYDIYLTEYLADDFLKISMSGGALAWTKSFTTLETNAYAAGEGAKGYMSAIIPGANAPGGSWDWADFNVPGLTLRIDNEKGTSSDTAILYMDAMGFRVTTNDTSCANGNSTIDPLPLDDTFDPTKLQFLSSNPPPSSTGSGTLHWDNLGPLYAGGLRTVVINYRALATATDTTNYASVTEAKFANGRDTNDPNDSANVDITVAGSISGNIFADTNNPGTWNTVTGYSTGDTFFPGTTVQLWGCFSTITDRILTAATAPSTNKECTYSTNNGEWRLIETAYTDINGAYAFTGLRDGYYNVIVDTTTLPPGFVSSVETTPAGNGAGGGAGDSQWNAGATANLNTFNDIANGTTGENITVVSFGYRDDGSNQGGLYGYVWNDKDGMGDWDTGEEPIPGVSVYVCAAATTPPCTSSNALATAVTDANGRFIFGNLAPGSYYTQVDTSDLPGMSQSGDPDQPGVPCTTCDNRNTTPVTVVANVITDAGDFGYTGGLSIGDTIYTDWNGDGDKDGSAEEGIPNVTVYLYRDLDGDGVVDPGDTLLATDVTDANGVYGFSGLAGNGNKYLVVVDSNNIPAGYLQTADPDATKDHQNVVTLNSDSVDTVDFGYQPRGFGEVGDFVWYDLDADGIQDSGEAGVPNVTINIYEDSDGDGVIDAEDALIATTVTLNYNVIDGAIDINGDGSIDTVGTSDDLTTGNGLYGYNVYDGRLDVNDDGLVTAADDGFLGIYRVIDGYLDLNGSGTITTADDGNLNGFYLFKDLPLFNNLPADDFVVQVAPAEFSSGGDLVGYGMTNTGTEYDAILHTYELALAANQKFYDVDFGFAPPGLIGDYLWRDNDGDGTQDAGETGIPNVTLQLWTWSWTDSDGDGRMDQSEVSLANTGVTATTNASGYYEFPTLAPGNYLVRVDPNELTSADLAGYTQTGDPDARTVPCSATDPTPADDDWWLVCNNQAFVTLRLGQTDRSVDFGYKPPRSIGDRVWLDIDGDTVQDPGEVGIAGVTVTLRDCGDNGTCGDGDDITYVTTTDLDGYYSFPVYQGRNHRVEVSSATLPAGLTPTYDYDGGLDHQATVNMSGYSTFLLADFGYRYSGSRTVSGTVFFDTGTLGGLYQSGTDNPIANVPVYLYNSSNQQVGITYTDASGFYQFTNLPNEAFTVVVGTSSPQLANLSQVSEPDDSLCTDVGSTCNNRTTIPSTGNVINQDFGFYALMDCGDLPETYNVNGFNTKLGKEGPCHVRLASETNLVFLGSHWDGEVDGKPDSSAVGDDVAKILPTDPNDEDGMLRKAGELWTNGATVHVNVTVAGTNAYLAAWFDWNDDGDFVGTAVGADGKTESAREYVYYGLLAPGTHELPVVIPPSTVGSCCVSRSLMTRFRLYEGNSPPPVIAPTGTVINGEVEDYKWDFGVTAVEMISLEARTNPGGLPAWAWITAAAVTSAGGLITLRAWRKRR